MDGNNNNSNRNQQQIMAPTGDQQQQEARLPAVAGGSDPYKALFDSIPQNGLKCDILFLVIKNRIQEEPDYVKKLRVVFQFNITKGGQLASSWICDTKSTIEGDIYRGEARPGTKVDCTLTVDDDDWVKIMVGKLNPQRAFMLSKFKIKGNIMLLQKLHALWFDLRRKGKTPELDLIQEIMVNEPLIAGLKSEVMAIEMVQRIVKLPHLLDRVNSTIQVDILQRGSLVVQYQLGLYPGKKPEFKRYYVTEGRGTTAGGAVKPAANAEALAWDVKLTLEDDEFVLLIYGLRKINDSIEIGNCKVEGPEDLIERAKCLLDGPPIMSRL